MMINYKRTSFEKIGWVSLPGFQIIQNCEERAAELRNAENVA